MPAFLPLIIAAGTVAGTEVAAASVVGGLMLAGGALATVGNLTGNRNLATWGTVLGLAGGVAGLASGAADTASSTIAASATSDTGTSIAGLEQLNSAAAASDAAGVSAGVADGATTSGVTGGNVTRQDLGLIGSANPSLATGAPVDTLAQNGGMAARDSQLASAQLANPDPSAPAGAVPSTSGSTGLTSATTGTDATGAVPASTSTTVTNPATASPFKNVVTPATNDPAGFAQVDAAALNTSPAARFQNGMATIGNKIKDASTWMQDNAAITKVGAGLIGGAANNYSAQQRLQQQYQLEAQATQAARDRYNASLRGLAAPTFVAPTKPA